MALLEKEKDALSIEANRASHFVFFYFFWIRSSFFIAVGAIFSSTCIMMNAYGAGGDDHPSSSFF